MKKKERKTKVSKYELMEMLKNNNGDAITKSILAKTFDVTTQTIGSVVKKLRRDGVAILPTQYGLKLVESIDTTAQAIGMMNVAKWMVGESEGLAIIAEALKRPMKEAYKMLPSTMTKAELQTFKGNLLVLMRQADILELEQ